MNMKAVLALLLGLLFAAAANAQSATAGKALFDNYCSGCHGTPPNLFHSIDTLAANKPSVIRTAMNDNRGGMSFAVGFLTDAQIADIAAYFGSLTAPPPPVTVTKSSADRILDWAEVRFADLLKSKQASGTLGPYTYRCYPAASLCVGIDASQIYLYELSNPNKGVYPIGSLKDYVALAQAEGF